MGIEYIYYLWKQRVVAGLWGIYEKGDKLEISCTNHFFWFYWQCTGSRIPNFSKVEEQDKHLVPIITKPHGSETEVVIDTIPLGKEDQESSIEIIMSVKLKGQWVFCWLVKISLSITPFYVFGLCHWEKNLLNGLLVL